MKQDHEWPERLSNPARRALASAGIERLDQLTSWRMEDVLKLHGMGRKGIDMLDQALTDKGVSFKKAEN